VKCLAADASSQLNLLKVGTNSTQHIRIEINIKNWVLDWSLICMMASMGMQDLA
jgi:hypothetical protein